ncbi:general odorant-binding protein 19d [Drosophila pseudoobscura]|uniref:General odorant-binding protein 19d n=1 Tax=Drosophila pseudoobscura pseudoobscura TaxID=46245 RepID=Q29IH4_DROPS|nr:general odorant-binding protein 19d [Drosophila pseudoobscura]
MSRLVCLGLMLAVCLVAVSESESKPQDASNEEHVAEAANECKAETGATDEDVELMMKHEPSVNEEGKCLRACMMKKFKIIEEDGKPNTEHTIEMMKLMSENAEEKEDAITEIADTCAAIDLPEDHCDSADGYLKCIIEHMEKHGITLRVEH